jgi:hypothetical protein
MVFLLSKMSALCVGTTKLPVLWVTAIFYPGGGGSVKAMSWHFIGIDSASFQTIWGTDTVVGHVVPMRIGPQRPSVFHIFNKPSLHDKRQTATWTNLTKHAKFAQALMLLPRSPVRIFAELFHAVLFSPFTPFNYVTIYSPFPQLFVLIDLRQDPEIR